MDQNLELALKTLNSEFKTIKSSLEPLSAEFKKINFLEIELKRLKSEVIPKIKALELRGRESAPQKDNQAVSAMYRGLEAQLNKMRAEILELRKKPVIDKEQDSALRMISENQGLIDVKLKKINRDFEDRYKKQIETNKEMIVNLISEKDSLKHEIEKNSLEFEKIKKEFEILHAAFHERDSQLTKDVNTRKRHINQVVDELNEARKKIYLNGTIIAENQEKIDDIKTQLAKIKNDLQNVEKSNSTKVDIRDIEDTKISFSRLEKKTISDISEIKARMRELERKVVGKKDIDQMQTAIDGIQTNEINKLKEEFTKLSSELSVLPNHVEAKLSNLKRVMGYIEMIKKDIDKLNSRTGDVEAKFSEFNRIKSDIENVNKNIRNMPAPREELADALNYVEVIKKDHDRLRAEYEALDARLNKLSESSADLGVLNSIKKDVAAAISKSEKLSSVVDLIDQLGQKLAKSEGKMDEKIRNMETELERINIKAESTSRILKEMDKVL
ncbi:MAG: hypothetical protein PHC66_03125 [Candidatus Nanoarchaeia archaeon]|nr:hypothetical protein [Candidatus Nanoarchaeia archaeon]MDD5239427.1 hypothetical protein [Candidatus Nanoarchaeia archaeon]